MNRPENQPAFPTYDSAYDKEGMLRYQGMTLRDYFAGQALALTKWNVDREFRNDERSEYLKRVAEAAYQTADAMLKARQS